MTMPPFALQLIQQAAKSFSVPVYHIIAKKQRNPQVVAARMEVTRQLSERGWSSTQIGGVLNKDHTTILFYLGRLKRAPSLPALSRWRTPVINCINCDGCKRCLQEQEPLEALPAKPRHGRRTSKRWPPGPRSNYLVPYAGAEPDRYVWIRKPRREDHRSQEAGQADHAGEGGSADHELY